MIGADAVPVASSERKIVNATADRYVQENFFEGITRWQRLYWKLCLPLPICSCAACCAGPAAEVKLPSDRNSRTCYAPRTSSRTSRYFPAASTQVVRLAHLRKSCLGAIRSARIVSVQTLVSSGRTYG